MQDAQNSDCRAVDRINDKIGRAGDDQLARPGEPARAPDARMDQQAFDCVDNSPAQRLRRIEQAQSNHDLIRAEQERLVEQVKLIRADAIATKNADTLTARIDLSIEHLAATNRWLSEVAEFKDLTAQMPPAPPAAGAAASNSPPQKNPSPPQSS